MTPFRLTALALLITLPGRAADPPAETLLKLVPDDTAVCVVVRDLRGHSARLAESPFLAEFTKSPLGRQFGGEEGLKKLADTQTLLTTMFGVTAEQIRDVVGDAVVFAFTPGPADKPESDRSLLLIMPKTPAVLAALLTRIDQAQKASGELSDVTTRTHKGTTFTRRDKKTGGAEHYALVNGVFVFSSDESALTGVLDRLASATPTSPAAASLARLKADRSLVTVWLNPRAFDAAFAAKARATTDPNDRHGIETVAAIWKGVTDAALLLDLSDDLRLTLAARFDPAGLPATLRPFLLPAAGGSALAAVVPEGAILTVLGRLKPEPFLALADTLTPPAVTPRPREQIDRDLGPLVGKDKLPVVLEAVGPDWGFWAVSPETGAAWSPEWTLAVKVNPAKEGQTDPAKALLSGVESFAQMIRIGYNQSHADQIDLLEETVGGIPVKSLVNPAKFPPGFRPSFAMKGGYFLLASSPAVIGKFQAPSEAAISADADTVVRLSAARLRAYLSQYKDPVAAFLAESHNRPAADVRAEIAQAVALLEPFDSAELRMTVKDGVTRLTLRLKTVKALKK